MENESKILSPVAVWADFDASLPLKESKVSEDVLDNIVYSHMYFFGRDTGRGRVRIYGVYARNKELRKKTAKAGLLIIPDIGSTVDLSIINIYVKQGYAVLMIDYCGEYPERENYTKYPENVSYANYLKADRAIDYCDVDARSTAWYEWVAVARYGVAFLKNQIELEKIGVLGIKNGANIGWEVAGSGKEIQCFVPLFGAGWRTYKGIYKYSDKEIVMNDERLRYLAGVDAHSYAQNVSCPVFYMTATNSSNFDCDRAMDTVSRVSQFPAALNLTPRCAEVIDGNCKRNIDLFLAKYLLGFKVAVPSNPKVTVTNDDRKVSATVELDVSEQLAVKKLAVYIAEGGENPAFRDWMLMRPERSDSESKKSFNFTVSGNCPFVNVIAVAEYKNGFTVSSLMTCKKTPGVESRKLNLVYSSADKTSSFAVASPEKASVGGLFFEDKEPVQFIEGSNKIFGVSSPYGLVCYKFNNRKVELNERSLIVMDVDSCEYSSLKVTLVLEENGKEVDYSYSIALSGASIWQHVIIKCTDFKSEKCMSIKDFSAISALKLETGSTKCIFNNILIV